MQMQSSIQSTTNIEMAAWHKTRDLYDKECPHGTKEKPLPVSHALEKFECWNKLVQEYVAPVAVAPDLLSDFRLATKKIAIDLKKGKIDRDEADLKSDQAWNNYGRGIDQRAQQAMNGAYARDQATTDNVNKSMMVLYGIQQQNQVRQQQNPAPTIQMPTTTHCQDYGDHTLTCTTR